MMAEVFDKDNSKREEARGNLSAEAPKIFGEKVVPIVRNYRESLREEVSLLAEKDWRLGEISEKDLEQNEGYLKDLEKILEEYAEDPSSFQVVHFSFSEIDGGRFRLTFKRKSDPKRLPTEAGKALTQLNFELKLGIASESEEERLAAIGLSRSPAEAAAELVRTAPRETSLMMRTVKAHFSQALGKLKLDFLPGIMISSSSRLEKPILEGLVQIGFKRFKTDPEEIDLTVSDFAVFKDHIRFAYERESRREK